MGLQMMVIEAARNLLSSNAPTRTNSIEKLPDPVINMMEPQKDVAQKGGTMRLGAYPCVNLPGSLASSLYRETQNFRTPSPSL